MPLSKVEVRDRPFREPMVSLDAVVRDWQWRFPRAKRDTVYTYCAEAPTVKEAIRRACNARTPEGKMHNHQSRVKQKDREEFGNRLYFHMPQIHRAMREAGDDPGARFDAMYDYVVHGGKDVIPSGIGPVTVYDVLTRIGANPKVNADPTSLYLHAGCRQGWLALVGPDRSAMWRNAERVLRSEMPRELRGLPADEVEDLCCTYRTIFQSEEFIDRGRWPS